MTTKRPSDYPQVNFRPGALEPELRARAGADSLATVAQRDLARYYALLSQALPVLSRAEACVIAEALHGTQLDTTSMRLLWAEVADAIRLDGLDRARDIDGDALVQRLRDEMTPSERMAICDAVERAWLLVAASGLTLATALVVVGLVRGHDHA